MPADRQPTRLARLWLRLRLRAEDGSLLVQTLVAMAILLPVLGGIAYGILLYSNYEARSGAQAMANRQLSIASAQMASDVGQAQMLTAVDQGFDAAGATTTTVWETLWRDEDGQLVKYHWSGTPGQAYPGPDSIAGVTHRQVFVHGIDDSATSFDYFNSVAGQLNDTGTALAADASFLPGATPAQEASTSISRVTWDLAVEPGELVHVRHPIADVTVQGGNGKANSATPIVSTTLTCPSVLLTAVSDEPTLHWSDVDGADRYVISRDGAQLAVLAADAGDYSWTDSAAPTDRVSQYTVALQLDSARPDVPTCGPLTFVPAPVVSASWSGPGSGSSFVVTWPSITGVDIYTCYAQTLDYDTGAPAGGWAQIATTSGTSCTTPAPSGQLEQFKVTAGAGSLTSADSNIVRALAGPSKVAMVSTQFGEGLNANGLARPAPYSPTDTAAAIAYPAEYPTGFGTQTLSWYATADTAGYRLYANGQLLATLAQPPGATPGVTELHYPTTAALGSTTLYDVIGYNVDPNSGTELDSATSNTKSVLQYPPIPAITPVSDSGSRDEDGYNLVTWSPASSATGYQVKRAETSTSGDPNSGCITAPDCVDNSGGVAGASYDDFGINAGSRNFYEVWSYNPTGASPVASAIDTIYQRPAPPTTSIPVNPGVNIGLGNRDTSPNATVAMILNADAGNSRANRWCAVGSSACQYQITRTGGLAGTNPPPTTLDQPDDTGHQLQWPSIDDWAQTYTFQIRSRNDAITDGGWSNYATVKVLTPPGPFTDNISTNGRGSANAYNVYGPGSVSGTGGPSIGQMSADPSPDESYERGWTSYNCRGLACGPGVGEATSPMHSSGMSGSIDGIPVYTYSVVATAPNGLSRTQNTALTGEVMLPDSASITMSCTPGKPAVYKTNKKGKKVLVTPATPDTWQTNYTRDGAAQPYVTLSGPGSASNRATGGTWDVSAQRSLPFAAGPAVPNYDVYDGRWIDGADSNFVSFAAAATGGCDNYYAYFHGFETD